MTLNLFFGMLQDFCAQQLGLYSYQNYIEVIIFSLVIYKTLRWLQQDHTKQLLLYVYAYASVMIASRMLSCPTLFWVMFILMPVVALLCIVVHQKQLQKNFILGSTKYVTPETMPTKNWLEVFIRSCLLTSYQNKQIFCVMQREDELATLLHAPYALQLPIQEEIVRLILSSNALNNPSIIWITQSGTINSVNASWKESLIQELLSVSIENQNHACANLLTKKTDAVVFSIDPTTRLAMIWHQGKSLHQITIDQLITSCKQILYKNIANQSVQKSGVHYATQSNSAHSSSKLH